MMFLLLLLPTQVQMQKQVRWSAAILRVVVMVSTRDMRTVATAPTRKSMPCTGHK